MWQRHDGSSFLFLSALALFFFCLAPAHSQDTSSVSPAPASSIADSLQALNEISLRLDDIAMMSESELLQLKEQLLKARDDLLTASSSLTASEASRLNLESSLKQSETTLLKLEKRLNFLRAWGIASTAIAAMLLLVVIFR